MSFWESVLRPIAFRIDPERAHDLARSLAERTGRSRAGLDWLRRRYERQAPGLEVERWGLRFRNPVGLAGGFDKNAEMIPVLEALGFGFLEVGTVTLRPQEGSPRPRIFRFPEQRALINRLGFNNDGAEVVARRLRENVGKTTVPVLVNIGRNRDVSNEDAADAYREVYRSVARFAHGVTVNISSPNTPGLRELQRGSFLRELLELLADEREATRFETEGEHPILVKISPDMEREDLETSVSVCRELADGMIATNTTLDHSAIPSDEDEQGGLSGAPLREKSLGVLREIRRNVGPRYPLIGVGGIMSGQDARERIEAGADLIQLYTGLVYGGAGFPLRVASDLVAEAGRE